MNEVLGALVPLIRDLPAQPIVHADERLSADLGDGLVLIVTADCVARDRAMRVAMQCAGRALAVSRSRAAGRYAMVIAGAGRVGLDMETIERVARNTTPEDRWLAIAERELVVRSPDAVAELACHWMLKEAYGKARGVGLDLPLESLSFGASGGSIRLNGEQAPGPKDGWRFGLYRHGGALFGTAFGLGY